MNKKINQLSLSFNHTKTVPEMIRILRVEKNKFEHC